VRVLGSAGFRKLPVDLGVVVVAEFGVRPLRGETKGLWMPESVSMRRRFGAGEGSVILGEVV
jgi:hypothetical protein